MNLQAVVDTINSFVWGPPLVILCLGAGIYFSVRTRFLQVRLIKDMVTKLFGGKTSKTGISSFQGFAMALGGRVFLLVMTFYGSLRTATLAWGMGDIGVGLMAWLNVVAILILGKVGLAVLKDYEARKKAGGAMEFDPDKLGIRKAELWHEIRRRRRDGERGEGNA